MRTQKEFPKGVTVNERNRTVTVQNPAAFFSVSQLADLKRHNVDPTKPLTIDGQKAKGLQQFKQ